MQFLGSKAVIQNTKHADEKRSSLTSNAGQGRTQLCCASILDSDEFQAIILPEQCSFGVHVFLHQCTKFRRVPSKMDDKSDHAAQIGDEFFRTWKQAGIRIKHEQLHEVWIPWWKKYRAACRKHGNEQGLWEDARRGRIMSKAQHVR